MHTAIVHATRHAQHNTQNSLGRGAADIISPAANVSPKIGIVDRRSTGASKAPDTREMRDMSPGLPKTETEGSLALNDHDAEVRDLINQVAYSRASAPRRRRASCSWAGPSCG